MATVVLQGIFTVNGTWENPVYGPPRLQTRRRKYWGLHGESEILGFPGGRAIAVPMFIHAAYASVNEIGTVLKALDNLVGANATLTLNGTYTQVFNNCTFEGFERDADILPDIAGTMNNSYWTHGILHFYQLQLTE